MPRLAPRDDGAHQNQDLRRQGGAEARIARARLRPQAYSKGAIPRSDEVLAGHAMVAPGPHLTSGFTRPYSTGSLMTAAPEPTRKRSTSRQRDRAAVSEEVRPTIPAEKFETPSSFDPASQSNAPPISFNPAAQSSVPPSPSSDRPPLP